MQGEIYGCKKEMTQKSLKFQLFLKNGLPEEEKKSQIFHKRLAKKKAICYNNLEIGIRNPKKIFRRSSK